MLVDNKTIDLRIGEARSIRDIAISLFDLHNVTIRMKSSDWEYQSYGYQPLVKFLEEKHSAPIVITNGANQALHAAMYALKRKGYTHLGFRSPYWSRIPEIAKNVGIDFSTFEGDLLSENKAIDSYLLTIPNNPDGYLPPLDVVRMVCGLLKQNKMPVIHDAVYYTRTYLPVDHPVESIGDMQIFSASKTYGLSSLRVGYIIVHNQEFYDLLNDYMELATVGVSVPAQKMLLHLLQREQELPFLRTNFDNWTRDELKKAKAIFKTVNSEHIELPENFDRVCGMFAWVKPKTKDIFEKANVQVLDGALFGKEGYVRVNLAARNDIITEVVKRINNV
jgi:aspartate/methionine/tyrosine aminotransferase